MASREGSISPEAVFNKREEPSKPANTGLSVYVRDKHDAQPNIDFHVNDSVFDDDDDEDDHGTANEDDDGARRHPKREREHFNRDYSYENGETAVSTLVPPEWRGALGYSSKHSAEGDEGERTRSRRYYNDGRSRGGRHSSRGGRGEQRVMALFTKKHQPVPLLTRPSTSPQYPYQQREPADQHVVSFRDVHGYPQQPRFIGGGYSPLVVPPVPKFTNVWHLYKTVHGSDVAHHLCSCDTARGLSQIAQSLNITSGNPYEYKRYVYIESPRRPIDPTSTELLQGKHYKFNTPDCNVPQMLLHK